MNHYAVYGACLATTLEFPELEAFAPLEALPARTPKWSLREVPVLAPMQGARELGAEPLYDDVHARLFAHEGGYRIRVDDTGEFDLSADGTRIECCAREGAWPDFVRAHALGRVLATAMHLEGWLPLHGSAVALGDQVIGFLAPKAFGKSTLALALAASGARLVSDDLLPVEPGAVAMAWPGVHAVRLREDAGTEPVLPSNRSATREGKIVLSALPEERLQRVALPLAALYLLDPALPADGELAARRELLPAMAATLGVVAHAKIGRMQGPGAAGELLARAAAILRDVPVYRLSTARAIGRLPELVAQLRAWHLPA